MSVKWDGSLSVGIEIIDVDHQKLIEIINSVIDDTNTAEQLSDHIDELLDYTRYHFNREEAMMEEKGYADLEAHKEEHGVFIGKLLELAIMVETDGAEAARNETSNFLLSWLTNHIQKTDTQYVPCLTGAEA